MNKFIECIFIVIIFSILLSFAINIESQWKTAPQLLLILWFSLMVVKLMKTNEENEETNKKLKGITTVGLMKFQCWDKELKKYWHDFRIHPQGFVAPATSSKDGLWVYDWEYDQDKLVLYIKIKGKKLIQVK